MSAWPVSCLYSSHSLSIALIYKLRWRCTSSSDGLCIWGVGRGVPITTCTGTCSCQAAIVTGGRTLCASVSDTCYRIHPDDTFKTVPTHDDHPGSWHWMLIWTSMITHIMNSIEPIRIWAGGLYMQWEQGSAIKMNWCLPLECILLWSFRHKLLVQADMSTMLIHGGCQRIGTLQMPSRAARFRHCQPAGLLTQFLSTWSWAGTVIDYTIMIQLFLVVSFGRLLPDPQRFLSYAGSVGLRMS